MLGRASNLSGVAYSDMTFPEFYQQHVPGYSASNIGSSTFTPNRSFGIQGTELRVFSYDMWITTYYGDDSSSPTLDTIIVDQNTNLLAVDSKNIVVEFGAIDITKTVSLSYYNSDPFESKHLAVVWAGTTATLYVNGLPVDFATVPAGFEFANTTGGMVLSAAEISHFAFYDRVLSDEEVAEKYSYIDYLTSHAEACFIDGGDVVEMWGPLSNYVDIIIDDEYSSAGSLNKNIDSRGWHSPLAVDQLSLSTGTLTQSGTQTTLAAGQYLSVSASGYMSTSTWAISIETNDDNSRSGNEYLFTVANDTEALESYVTAANALVVKKTNLLADGTTTTSTYTYDTTVATNGRKFVFVYRDGRLYVKSGATGTVLNTVSSASFVELSMTVNDSTMLHIGTSADFTGNPVPVIKNLYVHRSALGDDITAGDYDAYQNQYYSRGYWPLVSTSELRGSAAQLLVTQPYVVEYDPILNAYLINDKSYNSTVVLTTSEGTLTTKEPIAAIPSTVIPYSGVAGVDFDPQIVSLTLDQQTNNIAGRQGSYSPGAKSTTIRMFLNRQVQALGSQSYINLAGAGACWVNPQNTSSMKHSKYAGTYFESGSVGGPVVDPLVDGSTIRYEYRAFEFLLYIDSSAHNAGHIVSIYNGTTEYYFRVNANTVETNFSSYRLNDTVTTDVEFLSDKWIHVYLQLPALVQDRQVYIGKAYNNASYANGFGIKNFAMYDAALTAEKITEHFQTFVGRFSASLGVVDSVSAQENASPLLYSVAWTNNVIPG